MDKMSHADNIGHILESNGWQQGSVMSEEDFASVQSSCVSDFEINDNSVGVVTTHSCCIANNNLNDGLFIEVMIGEVIDELKEDKTSSRNPRILHSILKRKTKDSTIVEEIFVEFKGYKTIRIPKDNFISIAPSSTHYLLNQELKSFVFWLGARFNRPALPTAFNDRIAKADPKKKNRKLAKSISVAISGLYVNIIPNAEIAEDENYKVNLLALVVPDYDGDLGYVEQTIERYADILKSAGMDVKHAVVNEKDISVATLRSYERFYFDDLSIRSDTLLPSEV